MINNPTFYDHSKAYIDLISSCFNDELINSIEMLATKIGNKWKKH